jgi:hypothetical protein
VEKKHIFKATTGNEHLHVTSEGKVVRPANSAKSTNLIVKSTMFYIAKFINVFGLLLLETPPD